MAPTLTIRPPHGLPRQYKALLALGIGANEDAIGIQDASGTRGVQVDCNTCCVGPGTAILIAGRYGAPWMDVSPASGTVAAGGSHTLTLTMDAAGLALGTHEATIGISSDDMDEPVVSVPVTLTVRDDLDPVTSVGEVLLRGELTGNEPFTVTVNDVGADVAGTNWSKTVTVTPGANLFIVRVTDGQGVSNEVTYQVTTPE